MEKLDLYYIDMKFIEIVAANTPCFSYGDTAVFCF